MLLLGEQDFAASGHDSFDANSLVMVTMRQATRVVVPVCLLSFKREGTDSSTRAETYALLEPMSSIDRKTVHDTVNEINGVETSSEGEDARRHVVIRPT